MPAPNAPSRVLAIAGALRQIGAEHDAAAHVLHRQGGTDTDTIACLLRAQILILEVLENLQQSPEK